MKLVIDIDEKLYNTLTHKEFDETLVADKMKTCILQGTPLPKGHGRLIDEDKIIGKIHGVRSLTAVLDAPTIIEADKGERR